MTWTSSFFWVTIFLFHDLNVSYIDRFIDTDFCLNLTPLPHLRLNNFVVSLCCVSLLSELYYRNSAMVKRQNTQSSLVFLASIFDKLLSVCLLLVTPQECTVQIQLWLRGKTPSPFLFFLLFVNQMYRAKFGTSMSICLLPFIPTQCTIQIQL